MSNTSSTCTQRRLRRVNERKNKSIQANVVYLKTDKRDFYTFANEVLHATA